MSSDAKDTIYVDVDDEITAIVSKVQKSSKNIVALVLPKRASVLQSTVNMKLLKRTSEQAKKKVVLITSESRILPLAGAVGMFVAPNLTSKPYIPLSPKSKGEQGAAPSDEAVSIAPETPVSELAPDAKFADSEKDLEIDNTKQPSADSKKPPKGAKGSLGKKLKIPNFNKFRKRLLLGGGAAVLLIIFLIWAFAFAPKALVTVKAETDELPLSLELIADTKAQQADPAAKKVRATKTELAKEDSETVPATGEEDKGNKASGTMKITNCSSSNVKIPAGKGFTSGEFTFTSQKKANVPKSTYSFTSDGFVCNNDGNATVPVIAAKPGEKYNLSARSYNVSGYNNVSAEGSNMTGGTTKIVKVVSQTDIDKAKERLNSKRNTIQDEIKKQLNKGGFIAIEDSFDSGSPNYNPNPSVGAEAGEVTVSVTTTYSMLGVNKEDVEQVIKEEVKRQNEGSEQSILSNGLDSAGFKVNSKDGDAYNVTMSAKVITGPQINEDEIKQQITGKKDGEAEQILGGVKGFSEPKVELSPFWVTKVPKPGKIKLDIQQADGSEIPS